MSETEASQAPTAFGARLADVFASHGQLSVGIDPHDYLLDAWGLPRSAAGVREFGLRVVDAAAGRVGIVKPQVAFFELYGSRGFEALETVLAAARAAGLLVIADAKRGDIGTSAESYGRAWLQPGSPLEADAVTLAAYAGVGSLKPIFELAESVGKGAFVLGATSNPESVRLQTARLQTARLQTAGVGDALSVAGLVVEEVSAHNRAVSVAGSIGNIGVVLGATQNLTEYGIDPAATAGAPALPVLAPGFGFQGARFDDVRSVFGALTPTTVVAVSRSVLQAGPQSLEHAIEQQAAELAEALQVGSLQSGSLQSGSPQSPSGDSA